MGDAGTNGGAPRLLYGKDHRLRNLSCAQAAGGIITSLPNMTRWLRALYEGRLVPRRQQRELTSLVSEKTGDPIQRTTLTDPAAFGLGIGEATTRLGTLWYYEGETFSYRLQHVYVPKSGTVITIGVNSGTSNDELGQLAGDVYETLHEAGAA